MSKALFFLGAVGAGVAAVYLLDEKKGKKRRAQLKKRIEEGLSTAGDYIDEYSREVRDKARELSPVIGSRAQELGKTAQQYLRTAGSRAEEWSRSAGKNAQDYARVAGKNAGEYAKVAGTRASEYVSKDGRWSPSARFIGALGSALAFYGAGRPGIFGIVLRTLSLGMFTRALLASR
jgi:hypothetical protein